MGQVARVALAAALALAACDSGVSIEVDVGATGATKIELFVASHDACADCGALAGPTDGRPLAGSVFFRDPDATFSVDVTNGHATVNLAPGDGDNDVRTIVIVGLVDDAVVGASVLESFHVGSSAMRVLVSLEAANGDKLGDTTPSADPFRVELWRKQVDGNIGCVGVERWDGDSLTVRKFVVPEEDPDCDDIEADLECRPFQYKASARPDETSYSCLATFPVGSGTACMLGGAACVDGEGPATTCGPTPYCVPEAVCSTTCSAMQPGCLLNQLSAPGVALAHIECTLPVTSNGAGTLSVCDENLMLPVDMGAPFASAQRACTSARFANLAMPPVAFGAQMDLKANGSMTSDKLRVKLAGGFHGACQYDLAVSGTIDPMSSTGALQLAAVDLALDNDQHLVLPVRIELSTDCTTGGSCVAVYPPTIGSTQDSIVHCIE